MARGSVKRITTPKRKRVVWEARLNVADREGKRHQLRRRFGTKREAEKWLSEKESAVWVDGIGVTPTMTVAEYGTLWMARKEREWAPSTTYARRSTWQHRILPVFGQRRLTEITRVECQRFLDALAERYAPNYVRIIATQLRSMLNDAVRDELITRNPASRLTLPRIPRRDPVVWTAEQARHFLASLPPGNTRTLAAVMLYTGARIGEALALRWRAIDVEAGHLRIVATMSLTVTGAAYVSERTKTEASRRTVPITAALASILCDHRDRQREWLQQTGHTNSDDLVFLDPTGNLWHTNTARAALGRAIRATDVPVIPPHNMRHSFSTLMLEAGVHPLVVSRLLGHSGIGITMDIYTHPSAQIHQDAIGKLGDLIGSDDD